MGNFRYKIWEITEIGIYLGEKTSCVIYLFLYLNEWLLSSWFKVQSHSLHYSLTYTKCFIVYVPPIPCPVSNLTVKLITRVQLRTCKYKKKKMKDDRKTALTTPLFRLESVALLYNDVYACKHEPKVLSAPVNTNGKYFPLVSFIKILVVYWTGLKSKRSTRTIT